MIQNRFSSAPEIYKQFLEILQTYQRESKPIQDVYAQVTQLFNTAPDLLEDFKQFLPESAAHARAQERQRMAAEEAAPTSSLRGEPMGLPSQTPNRDVKMPPLGQFNVKDGKESKKRRGAPGIGAGSVAGPSGVEGARMPDAQARTQGAQYGNGAKVRLLLSPFLIDTSSLLPLLSLMRSVLISFHLTDICIACEALSRWQAFRR